MERIGRRNSFCYQVYTYSKKSLLLFYIVTLYYLALGLTYTNIAVISVIGTAIELLSEIPTGVIADRYSRKRSLQVSEALKFLSLLFMLLGRNFYFLCFAAVLWGVADSCESGADQALLYEAFTNHDEYDQFLTKIYSRGYLASAIATASAAVLFSINIYLPLILSLALTMVSLVSISCFQEGRRLKEKEEVSFFHFNQKALTYIKSSPPLTYILLLMSLCTLAIMTINSYCQPLLLEKGLDMKALGLLMLGFNLLMSLGSKASKKIKLANLHYIIAALFGLCAVAAGFSNLFVSIFVFAVCRFANGAVWPILTVKSNLYLQSEIRSTVMSYQNMFTSVLCMLADPVIGVALDQMGLNQFYVVFGVIFVCLVLALYLCGSQKEKEYQKEVK